MDIDLDSPVVLIHGPNGSGKTSLIEALHYSCYLRSFKTHLHKDIAHLQTDGFGIALGLTSSSGFDTLNVTFNRNKKTVKLNQQQVGSYKELYDIYKVVTITEDDLLMIQGAPSLRRSFVDHMVLLVNPEYAPLLKKYRTIVDNRNALIASGKEDAESYALWTDQLLKASTLIQKARIEVLKTLERESQELIKEVMGDEQGQVRIDYQYARPYEDIEGIMVTDDLETRYPSLKGHERAMRRSVFGAHLDDFTLFFQGKSCRTYASRGQQKLLVFLLKLAHIKALRAEHAGVVLLVDDFMSDFDEERAKALLPLMTDLPTQLILTTPVEGLVKEAVKVYNTQYISIQDVKKV